MAVPLPPAAPEEKLRLLTSKFESSGEGFSHGAAERQTAPSPERADEEVTPPQVESSHCYTEPTPKSATPLGKGSGKYPRAPIV